MVQCGIAVRRVGPRGWLKVTGELTTMTSRHLDDYLSWLITEGVRQITVSLATAHEIDQASLGVLRAAQAELHKRDGALFVTAARATTRRKLDCLTRPTESRRVRAS
jgi:anti-anti-sigma regulatory factor